MAEIIFGIDHGNGNMKGSNVDFPCGLVRYTSELGRFMNEDILEYKGIYYTLSETRMPFKADKTVDLLVIRKGQPDLSVRVSDRSGMAILRSEISNVIQQNFGIHLESSDVE